MQKVEITGLDTSSLPRLGQAEMRELLKRAKSGDEQARERFIQCNLRLVLSVVQRFSGRGELADDLFQVGCIGLLKSVDGFDLDQDVRFSTYAVPMIAGEIRRHLRDYSAVRVPRSLRDTAYRAMQAKIRLTESLSREPSVGEIAKELGMNEANVVFALDAISDRSVSMTPYSIRTTKPCASSIRSAIRRTANRSAWIPSPCAKGSRISASATRRS